MAHNCELSSGNQYISQISEMVIILMASSAMLKPVARNGVKVMSPGRYQAISNSAWKQSNAYVFGCN